MVSIAVTPDTNKICVVGAIIAALAIVGAEVVMARKKSNVTLLLLRVVPNDPATADPMLTLVMEVETPLPPMLMVLVAAAIVAPESIFNVCAAVD